MKKFLGNKPLDQIEDAVKANGWAWDDEAFHRNGSDYVSFQFKHEDVDISVVYNTFNGTFFAKIGKEKSFTERSTEMDGTPWYDALLNFIYRAAEETEGEHAGEETPADASPSNLADLPEEVAVAEDDETEPALQHGAAA